MLNDRQRSILRIIDELGDISLHDLTEQYPDVSAMTLRRDLIQLENESHILRTRGGAVSIRKFSEIHQSEEEGEENEYAHRVRENREAKRIIAEKALSLVQKGSSLYFDAGSTIMALAKILPEANYTIITNGTNIAQELILRHGANVTLPGGALNRNTLSVSGPVSLQFIEQINIEYAFMSASAFSLEAGFTVSNIYEAELKKAVIRRAKKTILLLDSSKIGKNLLFTVALLREIHAFVCETRLPAPLEQEAAKFGIEIL